MKIKVDFSNVKNLYSTIESFEAEHKCTAELFMQNATANDLAIFCPGTIDTQKVDDTIIVHCCERLAYQDDSIAYGEILISRKEEK